MMEFYDLTSAQFKEANLKEPITTTPEEFAAALRSIGVVPGMRLVVHTSLRSFGTFEGGAEAYCRTLTECITESGTLMFPGLTRYPKDGEPFCYDPRTTPVGVGAAPECFRTMPGVVRSWDPTHSFCVWGAEKERYVRNHHNLTTMHKDSPLGLLEQSGGYCLMAGCFEEVTFMHVVETSCHAPCLGARTESYPAVLPGIGSTTLRGWGWRKGPCRALRHNEIYAYLRENGLVKETMLGRSHLQLFKLSDYRTAYSRLLTAKENGCAGCPVRPRQVAQSLPSDWDDARQCLLDSEAFRGEWKKYEI